MTAAAQIVLFGEEPAPRGSQPCKFVVVADIDPTGISHPRDSLREFATRTGDGAVVAGAPDPAPKGASRLVPAAWPKSLAAVGSSGMGGQNLFVRHAVPPELIAR